MPNHRPVNFQRSESSLSYYYLLPSGLDLSRLLWGSSICEKRHPAVRVMMSCPSRRRIRRRQTDVKWAISISFSFLFFSFGNFHFFVCSKCSHLPVSSLKRLFSLHNFVISESSYLTHNIYL